MDSVLSHLTARGSPFELLGAGEDIVGYRHAPHTLADLYRRARNRARSRDAPFLVVDDARLSLRELFMRADLVGSSLASLQGSGAPFKRIALLLSDAGQWSAALIAITEMGSAAVLVPYSEDAHAVSGLVATAGCDLVLTEHRLVESLRGVVTCRCEVMVVAAPGSTASPATTAMENTQSPTQPPKHILPEDEAIVSFTSGSTGRPKGIVLSHRGIVTGLWNMMLEGAWGSKRTIESPRPSPVAQLGVQPASLLCSSLSHIGGYTQLLLMLAVSGKVVLIKAWNPQRALKIAQRETIRTLFGATPTMIRELLAARATSGESTSLESFSIHGSGLLGGLVAEILEIIPHARIGTGYGMTETNGSIATTSVAELKQRPCTCGPVVPTAEVVILDDSGMPLKSGESGNICVRGPMLMIGYCNDGVVMPPGEGGWFRTGDVGKLDEDGYLYVAGRRADSVQVGNRTIYCSDVERLLDEWRCGEDSVALGVEGGQRILIGLIPGASQSVDTEALKLRIGESLGLPAERLILICLDIPRTLSGKLDRQYLVRAWHNQNDSHPEDEDA
jgi:long-chain acyl-CoA synthetase